ncbi:MAG TPA: peptide chain release factor N(5)-glutamine methyltransferase [Syntrophobacteraceae bacterium]|nr:peptide chain release factor N(5)-glutamine methyltransferase [Syntrophobacteraceae bacterium]HBZ53897.1 peptide chain release factor N(5)-glutamine methyltransferase [Syntrophobacteraceae bacterium]
MEEPWTILRLIQWTTQYFSRKGVVQPRTDAEVLLAHILRTERLQLYLRHDQPLQPRELIEYREAVRRRGSHEPLQYITGRQEFWSLELEVTPSVLIPRPETEILVEKALALLQQNGTAMPWVLDLGTGSGAIAVALAHENPQIRVVATDISSAALEVARRNACRHGAADRIRLVAMDLCRGLADGGAAFDLIVSNPPYIASSDIPRLAPEIARYEPRRALDGGSQGLDAIRRIADQAHCHLKPSASLLVEVGQGQAELIRQDLSKHPAYQAMEVIADYAGIPRVLHLRHRSGP